MYHKVFKLFSYNYAVELSVHLQTERIVITAYYRNEVIWIIKLMQNAYVRIKNVNYGGIAVYARKAMEESMLIVSLES